MTDPAEPTRTFSFRLLSLDLNRIKGGMARLPPIPREFLEPIGCIITCWSDIERDIDTILGGLLRVANASEPGWERRNFKKRRKLFNRMLTQVFGDHPNILKLFGCTVGKAAEAYWKRNLIAQGRLTTSIEWEGVYLTASGTHNGRQVQMKLKSDDALDLMYELASISASVAALFDHNHHSLKLASNDRLTLREFAQKARLPPPSPSTP